MRDARETSRAGGRESGEADDEEEERGGVRVPAIPAMPVGALPGKARMMWMPCMGVVEL
jgi:hypothetical protein